MARIIRSDLKLLRHLPTVEVSRGCLAIFLCTFYIFPPVYPFNVSILNKYLMFSCLVSRNIKTNSERVLKPNKRIKPLFCDVIKYDTTGLSIANKIFRLPTNYLRCEIRLKSLHSSIHSYITPFSTP
jgi:hypothetical protein